VVTVPDPGYDEVVVSTPAGQHLCNSLACAGAGTLAEVIVTFGVLADPGAFPSDRSSLWPESWGRSVPMCTGCWDQTRPVILKYRPAVIRDVTGLPPRPEPSGQWP
jgi:hypothetical protein